MAHMDETERIARLESVAIPQAQSGAIKCNQAHMDETERITRLE